MNFFPQIYEFPKPVIAAVNGPAMAGGCGLASVCDIVLAAEDAVFGYPEVRVGFVLLWCCFPGADLRGEKGPELLLTGRVFSAQEAQEMGLGQSCRGSGVPAGEGPRVGPGDCPK